MIKKMSFTRCTCDVCKRAWDIENGAKTPLMKVCLPMNYYDETGRYICDTTAEVEMCKTCERELLKVLEQHYRMRYVEWSGVEVDRKEDERK